MNNMAVIQFNPTVDGKEHAPTKRELLRLYDVNEAPITYIEKKQKTSKIRIVDPRLIPIRGSVPLAQGRLGKDAKVDAFLSLAFLN